MTKQDIIYMFRGWKVNKENIRNVLMHIISNNLNNLDFSYHSIKFF